MYLYSPVLSPYMVSYMYTYAVMQSCLHIYNLLCMSPYINQSMMLCCKQKVEKTTVLSTGLDPRSYKVPQLNALTSTPFGTCG